MIELPSGGWPDLIEILIANIGQGASEMQKVATLQAIGYICEFVPAPVLALQSNQILTAVVQGAVKEEPSQEVRHAAIQALYNSLEFVRENMEREGERNYIMTVVCEATQSPKPEVITAAFECLVRIMNLYYDKMRFYMEKALFGLTVLGMRNPDPGVALQAVEFWSTVCDEEIDIIEDIAEAQAYGEEPMRTSYHFARSALPEVVPELLKLLMKQDEDADDDDWNVSMAAGTCLALFAQVVNDAIVPYIVPYVETNIRSTEWREREAAVMAFGSILDGPGRTLLSPLVQQALPLLIEMMRDSVLQVKDTTAWTLGRICDLMVETINLEAHLNGLVTALVNGLDDNPKIITNCCWAIMNLAGALGEENSTADTGVMSQYFEGIVTALMRITENSAQETGSYWRTSAYEAISSLVIYSAKDCVGVISNLTVAILDRLDSTVQSSQQVVGMDDRSILLELQSNLCGVLTNLIRYLGNNVTPLGDRIMTTLLQIMQSAPPKSTIIEDAFLAVGAVTAAVESNFKVYMDSFAPFLYQALQNHEEWQLCSIAVGLIGDVCRALGEGVGPYCNTFMEHLLSDLQSNVLHRNVKPHILSCFGDIALAIGGNFEAYLEMVMVVLQQATSLRATEGNHDMIDYVNQLREGITEAYVGIVQGFTTSKKQQVLIPHANNIFGFLSVVASDPDRSEALTKYSVGLLGDLAEAFPNGEMKQLFQAEWIPDFLKQTRTNRQPGMKELVRWAREMVKRSSS